MNKFPVYSVDAKQYLQGERKGERVPGTATTSLQLKQLCHFRLEKN